MVNLIAKLRSGKTVKAVEKMRAFYQRSWPRQSMRNGVSARVDPRAKEAGATQTNGIRKR